MDEAQLRVEVERELRAQIEQELRAEIVEKQEKARLDAAFAPHVRSANRESTWERSGVNAARPDRESAAGILGAALADQMIGGLAGTPMNHDGYGDGTSDAS